MSLLWTLRKWIDPIEYAREEEDRRRSREDQPADPREDDGKVPRVDPPPEPETWFACRLCGHRGRSAAFCPRCLAPTMVADR